MPDSRAERRLVAILSGDVAGYSRLMAADEDATVRTLAAYREQVAALVREHRGTLADFTGDAFLAEFPAAQDAVACALELQRVLAARNAALALQTRLEFRLGVHLGDVRHEDGRLFGNDVNIAARLHALADPGGLCISDFVRHEVATSLGLAVEDLGERELKNIAERVHVFRVDVAVPAAKRALRAGPRRRLRIALVTALALVAAIVVALVASWPRPLGLVLDLAGVSALPVNPPLPDEPSLVVLPFQNLSGDPEQEYFSDGITEDLTTDLSRLRQLFVIARNSAFTYKGKAVNVEQVGRELGVRYVVEGSVQKSGERVRITVQLIDATSGFHVWSERYDRELGDVFALQSEITAGVLQSLRIRIREAETERAQRKPTESLSAWDAHLRAIPPFFTLTRAGFAEARRWLDRAIELDPRYADAHAMRGGLYATEYRVLWSRDPELIAKARVEGLRALELDPESAQAHMCLANAAAVSGRHEKALALYRRASELDPNWEPPHLGLAISLLNLGRYPEALGELRRALRLNPRNPMAPGVLGIINLAAGRKDEGAAQLEASRAYSRDNLPARVALAGLYESEGRHAEARGLVAEIRDVNPTLGAADAASVLPPALREAWTEHLRRAGMP